MSKIAILSYWDNIEELEKRLNGYSAVFATDRIAKQLYDHGIKVDAAIADFDSIMNRQEVLEELKSLTTVIELDEAKDMSDTEAAIDYATSLYPDADIDIYNLLAGRFDHTLALLSLFKHSNNKVTIYSPSSKVTVLAPGTYEIRPNVHYQYISFHALSNVENIELKQLKYPVKLAVLEPFSSHLISNEFIDNHTPGTITFDAGTVLCIYSRDESE